MQVNQRTYLANWTNYNQNSLGNNVISKCQNFKIILQKKKLVELPYATPDSPVRTKNVRCLLYILLREDLLFDNCAVRSCWTAFNPKENYCSMRLLRIFLGSTLFIYLLKKSQSEMQIIRNSKNMWWKELNNLENYEQGVLATAELCSRVISFFKKKNYHIKKVTRNIYVYKKRQVGNLTSLDVLTS